MRGQPGAHRGRLLLLLLLLPPGRVRRRAGVLAAHGRGLDRRHPRVRVVSGVRVGRRGGRRHLRRPTRDVGRSSPRLRGLRGLRGRRRDVRGGPGCGVRIGWMVQGGRDGGAGGQADMQDGRAVAYGSSLEDDVISADGRRRRINPWKS